MFSVEQARKIEPEFKDLSDEEILEILNDQYGLVQLAYDKWIRERVVPKIP